MNALRLAQLRESRGLSLEQIADSTKISLPYLHAIERENFEALPGGIFSTSYLRQYAAFVGVDEGILLARFHEKVDPVTQPDSTPRRLAGWWFWR